MKKEIKDWTVTPLQRLEQTLYIMEEVQWEENDPWDHARGQYTLYCRMCGWGKDGHLACEYNRVLDLLKADIEEESD